MRLLDKMATEGTQALFLDEAAFDVEDFDDPLRVDHWQMVNVSGEDVPTCPPSLAQQEAPLPTLEGDSWTAVEQQEDVGEIPHQMSNQDSQAMVLQEYEHSRPASRGSPAISTTNLEQLVRYAG